MNRHSKVFILIIIALGVLLVSGMVLTMALRRNQTAQVQGIHPPKITVFVTPSPPRPWYCVPLPRTAQQRGSPTSRPFPLTSVMTKTPNQPPIVPTVTPRVYANIVDLSPEVPLRDKVEIVVFRCDGTFDQFLAGPEIDVYQYLNLGPGDVVINIVPPASLMGVEPPEPTNRVTNTPSP